MGFYNDLTANFPRNETDRFFDLPREARFEGWLDRSAQFIAEDQLMDAETWRLYVEQFRCAPDDKDRGWRGEFWGKMMRGACFVYSYTKDEALFAVLEETVRDLLSVQEQSGRISTYSAEREYDGWDLWGRKYVLLGMQYFVEICSDDALKAAIIESMKKQVDYMMQRIGRPEDGKLLITKLSRHWRGVNSSSILEPIVRLYSMTGEEKYLEFAGYIVDCGVADVENLFELAYRNEMHLYHYPVTKAYELTSCFMGLLEYYRITKNERHLKAVIHYANRVLEEEFTVIGSAGCTHELFDHSTVRQANPDHEDDRQQETCVTVTLMQFFLQLNLITGDPRYMDAFERSLYNGYLGAINTQGAIDRTCSSKEQGVDKVPMTFDSYSPLTPGKRANGTGGFKTLGNGRYAGCCDSIASAGIGVAMKAAVLTSKSGLVVNLYEKGKVSQPLADGSVAELIFETDYPADGRVKITVNADIAEEFELLLRNPAWSEGTKVWLNGKALSASKGYISFFRPWKKGDTVELEFDLRTKVIRPILYGSQVVMNKVIWGGANYQVLSFDREHPSTRYHLALQRGPLMLARENRLGYNVDDAVEIAVDDDECVATERCNSLEAPYECTLLVKVPTVDGGSFAVTDYASAGKLWTDENRMAVWMNTK